MDAPADVVTDFVADIKNMPKYMPTTKKAEDAGENRVRVAGGGDGFEYDTEISSVTKPTVTSNGAATRKPIAVRWKSIPTATDPT